MRWLRPLLIFVIFLASLLLAAVCALTWLVTPQRIEARLMQTAAALHAELTLAGDIQVERLPTLRIRLPAASWAWDNGALHFDGADLELTPFAIFATSPKIERLTLTRPTLALHDVRDWRPTVRPQGFDIGRLDIVRGHLQADALTLDDVQGSLLNVNESGADLALDARARLGAADGRASLTAHALWQKDFSEVQLLTPLLNWDGLVALRPHTLSANARLLTLRADNTLAADNLHFELRDAERQWRLDSPSLSVSGRHLQSDALMLRLEADEGRFSAQGRLAACLDTPVWSLSDAVITSQNALPESSRPTPERRMSGSLASDASGVLSLNLEGRFLGEALQIHVNALPQLGDEARLVTGGIVLGHWRPNDWLPVLQHLSDYSAWHLDTSLRIGSVNGTDLSDVLGRLVVQDGRATLLDARARLWGAEASADAMLDASGLWRVRARVNDADVGRALTRSHLPAWLSGRLAASLELSGNLAETDSSPALTMDGSLENAQLQGIDLELARRLALSERSDTLPAEILQHDARTPVRTFNFALAGKTDALQITALEAQGERWRLQAITPAPLTAIGLTVVFEPQDREPGFRLPLSAVTSDDGARWTLAWDVAAAEVRALLGDDAWNIEGLKRRVERWVKNFEAQLPDPRSILDEAKKALGVRENDPASPSGAPL